MLQLINVNVYFLWFNIFIHYIKIPKHLEYEVPTYL